MIRKKQTDSYLLRDDLDFPGYRWPCSLIQLPDGGEAYQSAADSQGRVYPVQRDCGGGLWLETALETGETKIFSLSEAPVESGLHICDSAEALLISNPGLALRIEKTGGGTELFEITGAGARFSAGLAGVREKSLSLTAQGGVYAEAELTAVLEDGTVCRYQFRLSEKSEFVEFQESYDRDSSYQLRILLTGLDPDVRFTPDRKREKIDQYLYCGGYLPVLLLPYEASIGWYQTKCAAFGNAEAGVAGGFFIKDETQWQDYKYALWSSDSAYGIQFQYQNNCIEAIFPIARAARCTGLTLYRGRPEYIEEMYTWHCFYALNKVKDWVLDWEEDQSRFPVYFAKTDFGPETVERELLDKERFFQYLAEFENLRVPAHFDPVCNRTMFAVFPVFDALAPEMTAAEFDRCRRYIAFMAYSAMDENFMPVDNMLAGHPNFLMDARIPAGIFGAYFPGHPHARVFTDTTEKAVALNLKYHTRPEVGAWNAQGGRWTENLGCYTFAMLAPLVKGAALMGDDILLYPAMVRFAGWLLGALSAPVGGLRCFPPQGAHAGGHLKNPFYPVYHIRVLASMLEDYAPALAEQLYGVCPTGGPEWHYPDGEYEVWHKIAAARERGQQGIKPALRSAKFTGYGYILRSHVNTGGEMSVHIGQIDEGPNYRMGLAGDGGCGVIYYYADGRQYSANRPEDVGDYMLGDVDNCTSFGVMRDKDFRGIGRGDLSNPLLNFGVVQWAELCANPAIQAYYKSKGVLMADNDYIVIYETVAGMRTKGRLSWFVNADGDFPNIYQVKPGAKQQPKPLLPAKNTDIETCGRLAGPHLDTKGVCYDGHGDFLTVVSHKTLAVQRTDYGARVESGKGTDYIFYDSSKIRYEGACSFRGHIGFIRDSGEAAVLSVIRGEYLRFGDVEIRTSEKVSVCLTVFSGHAEGMAYAKEPGEISIQAPGKGRILIDGVPGGQGQLGQGYHDIQIVPGRPRPKAPEALRIYEEARELIVEWDAVAEADGYLVGISGDEETYTHFPAETNRICLRPEEPRVYIRVQARNADFAGSWSPVSVACLTDTPHTPKGLKVQANHGKTSVSWGTVRGVRGYILYRDGQEVYRGQNTQFTDEYRAGSHYQVAAFNSGARSECSRARIAEGLLYVWDPMPDERFRRDTRSHEHGYDGFDFMGNLTKETLQYPPEN